MGHQPSHLTQYEKKPPKGFTQLVTPLSQARSSLAATSSGELVFFGGGINSTGQASDRVDICNVTSGSWTTATLSIPRYSLAATSASNLVFFGGGRSETTVYDRVDIYNTLNGSWSTATLSQPRYDLAATSVGNLVLFGGGQSFGGLFSNVVDVFDVTSNTWTTATLNQPRSGLAATSVQNFALFAGGFTRSKFSNELKYLDVVDIFDSLSGMWNTTTLSQARRYLAATSLGNLAFFGGGQTNGSQPSKVVDIFNSTSQTWSTSTLSQARYNLAASSIGEIVAVGGGTTDNMTATTVVDLFRISSNCQFIVHLEKACFNLATASSINKIFFGGGIENGSSKFVNVLNIPLITEKHVRFEIPFRSLKICEEIGRGAYGVVYRGRHKSKIVAIKKFNIKDEICHESKKPPVINEWFQKSLQILRKLNHPNVAYYFGGCSVMPNLCTVTEYYSEGSLYDLLHIKNIKLSAKQQLELARGIAEGMEYLHSLKPIVLHCNLKSSNIMLSNGVPKIIDCLVLQIKEVVVSKQESTILFDNWMAPEVLKDRKYTEKADVWSYGMVLYELTTNTIPYSQYKTRTELVDTISIQKKKPSIPKEREIPPILRKIMKQCWRSNPDRRPSFLQITHILRIETEK